MSYATDTTPEFEIGTVAIFTCNAGFSLNGTLGVLTCVDDDQLDNVGTWGGTEPTCQRKFRYKVLKKHVSGISYLQQSNVLL